MPSASPFLPAILQRRRQLGTEILSTGSVLTASSRVDSAVATELFHSGPALFSSFESQTKPMERQ
ncbi:hypothetical protein MUK42_37421 [Musa troglodytarum]|uniref:Uncharacterized protein n=1 Tax=Musa troglodytarum TaxID=320322 RepID=A0A9E7EDM1_9LILI|nr:hypothetical protein MUK42_37421 [Musa troglodytarum]